MSSKLGPTGFMALIILFHLSPKDSPVIVGSGEVLSVSVELGDVGAANGTMAVLLTLSIGVTCTDAFCPKMEMLKGSYSGESKTDIMLVDGAGGFVEVTGAVFKETEVSSKAMMASMPPISDKIKKRCIVQRCQCGECFEKIN